MTTAAFFDVDNTLVKGSSLFLIGRGMIARGLVSRRDIARYGLVQLRFRLRGEHLGHMSQAQDRALSLGAGLVVADLLQAGREVYDQRVAGRLWPQTVGLAKAHLAAGDEVWLVSAAPVELVAIIADRLGLTGGLGTISETLDGQWTGRLASPILHGPQKAVAVRDLAQQRGLDLRSCHAYSDSTNDQPLLEAVGHPHAVNPDRHLARTAAAHGWPVHRHRSRHLQAVAIGLRTVQRLAASRRRFASPGRQTHLAPAGAARGGTARLRRRWSCPLLSDQVCDVAADVRCAPRRVRSGVQSRVHQRFHRAASVVGRASR